MQGSSSAGSSPSRALSAAVVIGTVLQLAMVAAGHALDPVKRAFGIGGMLISLAAGLIYARLARESRGAAARGGAVAGGACALLGIIVSFVLGDVPAIILLIGTLSSALTGAIGGALGGRGAAAPEQAAS